MENAQYGGTMSAEPKIYRELDETFTGSSNDLGTEIYDPTERLIGIRFVDLADPSHEHKLRPDEKAVIPPARGTLRNVVFAPNEESADLTGVIIRKTGARNEDIDRFESCRMLRKNVKDSEWNKLREYAGNNYGVDIDHIGQVSSRDKVKRMGKNVVDALASMGGQGIMR